jgi:hypothetical protein
MGFSIRVVRRARDQRKDRRGREWISARQDPAAEVRFVFRASRLSHTVTDHGPVDAASRRVPGRMLAITLRQKAVRRRFHGTRLVNGYATPSLLTSVSFLYSRRQECTLTF